MDLKHKDLDFKDQAFKEINQELSNLGLKNQETNRLAEDKLYHIKLMVLHGETTTYYKVDKAKLIMCLLVGSNQQITSLTQQEVP